MSPRRIAALLAALGVALAVVGLAIGPESGGIEGAYFTRAAGTPAYSGVFTFTSRHALLSPYDANVWLGASAACCVAAVALLAVARARRPR